MMRPWMTRPRRTLGSLSALALALAMQASASWVRGDPADPKAEAKPEAKGGDPKKIEARAAYDRGAAAYDASDFTTAARELARADELVPNATVLELALKAALRGDDAVTAMTLADRAETRGSPGATSALATAVRDKHGRSVGRLLVRCPAGSKCAATVDDLSLETGAARWLSPGDHAVVATVDGVQSPHTVHVDAEKSSELVLTAPAKPSASGAGASSPKPPSPAVPGPKPGPSPAWFWLATGATVALGTVTVVSALDTRSKHEDFLVTPTPALSTSGQDAQTRTNVLLAVTITSVAATSLIALVVYKTPGQGTKVGVAASVSSLSLRVSF